MGCSLPTAAPGHDRFNKGKMGLIVKPWMFQCQAKEHELMSKPISSRVNQGGTLMQTMGPG